MATKKVLFNVKGVEMTQNEKNVFEKVVEMAKPVNYKEIAIDSMNDKAKIATLARLNTTYGVIDKVVENGLTTYELEENGE